MCSGSDGLLKLATLPEADVVLIAIVGTAGLQPALAAIRAGKDIAVASKEILVMAGEIVMREARERGVKVLAVDSEHSAIFQCLDGKPCGSVRRLWLTASGGPFRKTPKEDFAKITVERALKHPSWVMGRKITIDSATLFNKGLEMIEARWLFDIEMGRVSVVVHPQSIVHSMVEFVDGCMLAQLSTPDMCLPIQYALTYPERAASGRVQTSLAKLGSLTFEEPDPDRFPGADPRTPGRGHRRHTPGRPERRQRSRRGRLRPPPHQLPQNLRHRPPHHGQTPGHLPSGLGANPGRRRLGPQRSRPRRRQLTGGPSRLGLMFRLHRLHRGFGGLRVADRLLALGWFDTAPFGARKGAASSSLPPNHPSPERCAPGWLTSFGCCMSAGFPRSAVFW